MGLINSLPLFLIAHGATWKDQGTFNFTSYPFSFKLLWAPLVDTLYSKRFGRRKSWLVPIQLCTAGILLFLSFFIETFLAARRVILLTIIIFGIVFLTATQDICVDGLSISLFTATNAQWTSTTQSVGQTLGEVFGFSFILTFESANFTNKYIRKPLSIPEKPSGLISLDHFVRFTAAAFLIVTICIIIFFRERQRVPIDNNEETENLSLNEAYRSIWKLSKKKCIRQLTLISLLSPVGTVATLNMTRLALVDHGLSRANYALISIPVTLISITASLTIRHTKQPFIWFTRSYILCLISAIPLAVYIYFTPYIIFTSYYQPLLIVLLACNKFVHVLRITAHVGFFASISESRIGGTYMTFLVTLLNLGFSVNTSIILYIANWLPKRYAYVILVSTGLVLGAVWLGFSYRTVKRLQNLPINKWHLIPESKTNKTTSSNEQGEDDHEASLVVDK